MKEVGANDSRLLSLERNTWIARSTEKMHILSMTVERNKLVVPSIDRSSIIIDQQALSGI